MQVFISHSSKEAEIANKMCDKLEQSGYTCFIAPRNIRSGYVYAEELANGVDTSDVILLMLSRESNRSPHVLREIERAVTRSIPIIVYKMEEVELTKSMEYFLMTHQFMEAAQNTPDDLVECIRSMERARGKNVSESVRESHRVPVASVGQNTVTTIAKTPKRSVGKLLIGAAVVVIVLAGGVVWGMGRTAKRENAAESNRLNATNIRLGDTITLGSYNNEDIAWRVLRISEDGREAVVVAENVLTIKAFDAPDSGQYNWDGDPNHNFETESLDGQWELQAYVRGNNSWENSNIRTWLNSDAENVIYEGMAPTSKAMADGVNGYNTEKGFLCSFTDEELALIKNTEVTTKGNVLSEADAVVTQDKVFLLSMEELNWFAEADVPMVVAPTAAAVANDKSGWYQNYCLDYGVEATMWWLREPVEESASKCYLVGNGYQNENIFTWEVGVESFGIRPAMTIALDT